jgi:hypothetical protein
VAQQYVVVPLAPAMAIPHRSVAVSGLAPPVHVYPSEPITQPVTDGSAAQPGAGAVAVLQQ